MKILGYRVWTTLPGLLTLRSHHATYTWKPGENVATYKGDEWAGTSGHTGPIPCTSHNCPCGFWAYDTPENALNGSQANHKNVLGIVLGYGRVLLAETGWRAEKAKIIGIAHGWRTDLAKYAGHYQVPLVAMDKLEWLIEEHGGIAMADVPEDWTLTESVDRPKTYQDVAGAGTMYAPYQLVTYQQSTQAMVAQLLYGSWPPSQPVGYVTQIEVDWQPSGIVTYKIRCSCGGTTMYAQAAPIRRGDVMAIACGSCTTMHKVDIYNPQIGPPAQPKNWMGITAPAAPTPAKPAKKKVTTHRNTKLLSLPSPVNGASRVVSIAECKDDAATGKLMKGDIS